MFNRKYIFFLSSIIFLTLLRLFFIAILLGIALRFIGRLFRSLLAFSTAGTTSKKKSSHNFDDSQIQDADFKDL